MLNKFKSQDRLIFLAEKYNVFTKTGNEFYNELISADLCENNTIIPIYSTDEVIIAINVISKSNYKQFSNTIYISKDVFSNIILSDPTKNKCNVQWMLEVFKRFILSNKVSDAIRFVSEDLSMAKQYLTIFDKNKRKKKFIDWANKNEAIKWLNHNNGKKYKDWLALNYNPSDITQYKSLHQLYDAVDPFIEKKQSNLEKLMDRFVNLGEAQIPVKDRNWTVYIPLTTDAACVMETITSWCTSKPGNSMFNSYTSNNKKPCGANSNLYIIINNNLFLNKSNECYQIHFETKQIRPRDNGSNVNLFNLVLKNSEILLEYFHYELKKLAKKCKINNNVYLDYLISFGFTETLFDFLEIETPIIRFENRQIPKLPDMSKFKNIDQLILSNIGLEELPPTIGDLNKLEVLLLPNNKLKSLPPSIGNLKNLTYINIKDNQIEEFPIEISKLDPSNGGNLFGIVLSNNPINKIQLKILNTLLPTVTIYNE